MRSRAVMQAIADVGAEPFVWGVSDCVQFVRRVVESATGRSIGRELAYVSEDGAAEVMTSYGGMEAMVTALVGTDPVRAENVEDGDPVLLDNGETQMLGVRFGEAAVYKTARGVGQCRIDRAVCGWRVECLK